MRHNSALAPSRPFETPRAREFVRRWLLAIGSFAILIFFFSPSWAAFRTWSRVPELQGLIEVRRGATVLVQMANPGVEIPDALHAAIQWRLFFPVIGYVLNLPPTLLFALAHVGCVLVMGFIISVLRRHGWNWRDAALATIVLGAGGWFFASTGWLGYFDSWVVLALLIVAFARQSWPVWLACAWAPWVDERFVLGAPLAFGCRHLHGVLEAGNADTVSSSYRRDAVVSGAILFAFLVIRLVALASRSAPESTISGYLSNHKSLDAPVIYMLLGIWEGMRVAWIFVAAAIALVWRRRPAAAVGLATGVLLLVAVGLATVQDFARAMMLILPVGLVGFIAAHAAAKPWLPGVLRVGAVATLLLPAHHVMSDRVAPIYYIYHALSAFETPPAAVMPELHELRAIRAMERGEFVEAAEALSLAIRLSGNPAAPSKQRGILFATQQLWQEAARDFSVVVEHDPESPEGWFLRAQAHLALGDLRAAQSDMTEALARAPARWTERPDVMRFRSRLREQGGR